MKTAPSLSMTELRLGEVYLSLDGTFALSMKICIAYYRSVH